MASNTKNQKQGGRSINESKKPNKTFSNPGDKGTGPRKS